MMNRGLPLLDVDGPLNPYAAKPHARPAGYQTFRYTPGGGWYTGRDVRRHKGMRVWLNPGHGELLRALAEDTGLELVWATTWMHEANTHIGPAIGLPELPVIEFPIRVRGMLVVADLELDTERKRVRRGGVVLRLEAKEFAVLELLVVRAGQVVSHADIVEQCWDEPADPESTVVDAVVAQLRLKLGPPIMIDTVRGAGYIVQES